MTPNHLPTSQEQADTPVFLSSTAPTSPESQPTSVMSQPTSPESPYLLPMDPLMTPSPNSQPQLAHHPTQSATPKWRHITASEFSPKIERASQECLQCLQKRRYWAVNIAELCC